MKRWKFGLNLPGLLLFAAIMLPNLLWFAMPAPDDVLCAPSVTPEIDAIGSACQVLAVAALAMLKRVDSKPRGCGPAPWCCVAAYWLGWLLYYRGCTRPALLLALCLLPCAALLACEIRHRNRIALIPTVAFTACHLAQTLINHII